MMRSAWNRRFLSFRSARHSQRPLAGKPAPRFRPQLEQLEDRLVLSGDAVLHWNEVANQAAVLDHAIGGPGYQFGPTRTSRAFAIVHAAIFDAVNSIDQSYTPYLVGYPNAPANASIDAAAAQAGHDTLTALYPGFKPMFDAALAADLAGIPTTPALLGEQVGQYVASQILALRANDGSQMDAPGQPVTYVYGQDPGQWRPDPLHPTAKPLTPDWGGVAPFVVQSATQFGAPPPPDITSKEYADAYEQVKSLGGSGVGTPTTRTDEETTIGLFWGYDAQPGLCAPVRFYNQIAEVIAVQEGNTEIENARFFALINIAMADGGITCWNDKYRYDLWRPVTAIRENDPGTGPTGLGSGNPYLVGQGDPSWQPLGAPADNNNGTNFTPPFPTYTSGHATFGGALFGIMRDFYGTDNIHFTIVSDEFNTITIDQNGKPRPLVPRSYDSFSQAAEENGMSRIYLGIHFSFDKDAGIASGTEIANYVFQHILRPHEAARLAVGSDAGAPPEVKVYDAVTGRMKLDFYAYDPRFLGGVRVALGDVNNDGIPDLVTVPGPGMAARVRVFDGANGVMIRDFYAFNGAVTTGFFVASGDLTADDFADVVVGVGAGPASQVRAFNGLTGGMLFDFFAYGGFSGGVRVAVGDVDGDGFGDIVTGTGPGGPALVRAFSGATGALLRNFYAFDGSYTGGIFVAAGDINHDGSADIIVGAGSGAARVRVFDGVGGGMLRDFYSYSGAFQGGVRVAFTDLNDTGSGAIITGPGPMPLSSDFPKINPGQPSLAALGLPVGPLVRELDGASLAELDSFFAYAPTFQGGVFVGGA